MPDLEFKATGLDEAMRLLAQLPEKLERNVIRGAIRAAAKPIAEDAKRRVPVLSEPDARRVAGALKNSLRVRGVQRKNGMLTGGVTAGGKTGGGRGGNRVSADVFYARFLEFGTVKMAARPFLRPAIDTRTQAAADAFAQYMRERAEKELMK